MADQNNPVAFPTAHLERRNALKNSPARRLRGFARWRGIAGWGLVFYIFLFLATNFTLWSPDNIGKILNQISVVSIQGNIVQKDLINFPSGQANDLAPYDNGLAVVDTDTLYILQANDVTRLSMQLPYADPVIQSNARVVLAYDRGGKQFCLSNGIAAVADITLESPIVCANLSQGGVAVVTDENGYKSAVTVYNEKGEQEYKWSTSEYYIAQATVSTDGETLCVVGYHQESTAMIASLFFFDLSEDSMQKQVSLGDTVVYALQYMEGDIVAAIGDSTAFVCDGRGNLVEVATYAADDFLYFDVADNRILIATRSWQAATRADLKLFDRTGRAVGEFSLQQEPISMVLTAEKIAVLSATGITVYDELGQVQRQNPDVSGSLYLLNDAQNNLWAVYGKYAVKG